MVYPNEEKDVKAQYPTVAAELLSLLRIVFFAAIRTMEFHQMIKNNRTVWMVGLLAVCAAIPGIAQPAGMQMGDGVWLRDAYFGEIETFDSCLAHQPGQGMHHNHVQPVCLRFLLGDNVEIAGTGRTGGIYREKVAPWTHSPILGWSLDGYPIYGPYGYSAPGNPASPVKRMQSGYRLRSITARSSLPDWALGYHPNLPQQLPAAQEGPPLNDRFPLGRYVEDYEFVASAGDLDQFNGRTTVTPDFPNGTYAYFVTLKADGTPAFPYIQGLQYNGTVRPQAGPAGMAAIPTDALDYFNNGTYTGPQNTTDPQLKTLITGNAQTIARALIAWDPSAGPQTTWPGTQPAGARAPGGGVTTPAAADIQRIRTTTSTVYLNSNNLPSYVIGPWFAGSANGGVFMNWAAAVNSLNQIPRVPQLAVTKANTGLGTIGVWVNGVAIFNAADGASYRNAMGDDAGGGLVAANAISRSSASLEGGPVTPGSLVTAFAQFEAKLATGTEASPSPSWPTTLGGATVTVVDSSGAALPAEISFASPKQVNYRVPAAAATGLATVRHTAAGVTVISALNIVAVYPGIFKQNLENLAAAQVARIRDGRTIYEPVTGPITIGPAAEQTTLILYGTGLNSASAVTATIGGAAVPVAYSGPQGTFPGLDQINIPLPADLARRGKVDIVISGAQKPSNPVQVTFQ